jgi:uncharacterized protein (TIGR04255 family)
MADRHYANAPITEALIDLQVEYAAMPFQSDFEKSAKRLDASFPSAVTMHQFQVSLDGLPNVAAPVLSGATAIGMRLTSADDLRVLQLQRRGFTFSHLPPYTQWQGFCDEAHELWKSYVEDLKPVAVTRAAVRYINRIVVPVEKVEFGDYFNLNPKLPDGIYQTVTGCFMQVVLPQTDIAQDAAAVVNFALEPNPTPGSLSFLLDLDLFCTCRYESASEEIWATLAKLRTRKNKIFEACITDATRELFK